ncbi:unnamed protein product, partial [Polarella glacialis]
ALSAPSPAPGGPFAVPHHMLSTSLGAGPHHPSWVWAQPTGSMVAPPRQLVHPATGSGAALRTS